jgi:hypothetical protein
MHAMMHRHGYFTTAKKSKAGLVTLGVFGGIAGLGLMGLGRPLSSDEYTEEEVHRYDNGMSIHQPGIL